MLFRSCEKVELALKSGIEAVKIVIRSEQGIPTSNLKTLNNDLNKITTAEDSIRITKRRNIIIETKNTETVKKVLEVKTINKQEVSGKIIEDSITTKYVIRNIDINISVKEIAEEVSNTDFVYNEITRFTKKGSEAPIPVVLITEIGKTNRKEIKYQVLPDVFISRKNILFQFKTFYH